MRTSTILWCTLLLGMLIPTTGYAQSQNDGSIYSRFGIGLRQNYFSAKSQGMGGGGLALSSSSNVNFGNPASFSDQYLTRFSGGMTYESVEASAEGAQTGRLASGSFTGVGFGFPIKVNRTGLGFSYAPYSLVNYRVDIESSLISDPESGAAAPFTTSFRGNGGLQRLSAGIGHRVSSRLHLGVSADFIFGILEESQQTLFNSSVFTDRSVQESTRLNGVSATAGFRMVVPGMPDNQGLVVAGTINLPTTLKATRTNSLVDNQDRDTLGVASSGDLKLPLGFGLGLAYQPAPKWTIVADFQMENWSSFESDFDLPGYDASGVSNTSNRTRASVGAELWPAARKPFASWSSRVAYRLGLYTEQSYISPDKDHNIRSYGVTGGFSIPSLIPGTTIDLNLDVGQRGTTSNGLIQDRYIRFGLNLNFGERWFERPPLG